MSQSNESAMPQSVASATGAGAAKRGSWIPWIFVAGFGVVLLANSIMVYVAATTWTGIAVNRAYDKGLTYNRNLEAAARQEALGWEVSLATEVTAGLAGTVEVGLRDAQGAPLHRAEIVVAFERPTHEGHDFAVQLVPSGAGTYTAPFAAPLPGVWDVRLVATRGGDRFVATERVVLR
jgi:nitrogen fixation protein FixH